MDAILEKYIMEIHDKDMVIGKLEKSIEHCSLIMERKPNDNENGEY